MHKSKDSMGWMKNFWVENDPIDLIWALGLRPRRHVALPIGSANDGA